MRKTMIFAILAAIVFMGCSNPVEYITEYVYIEVPGETIYVEVPCELDHTAIYFMDIGDSHSTIVNGITELSFYPYMHEKNLISSLEITYNANMNDIITELNTLCPEFENDALEFLRLNNKVFVWFNINHYIYIEKN